jgi:hypothetical protein
MIKDNGYTITGAAGIDKIDVVWKDYAEIQVWPSNGNPMQSFDADGIDDYITTLQTAAGKARAMNQCNDSTV